MVVLDNEEQHLRHATGINDEEKGRPGEDFIGTETCGREGLGRESNGEDSGGQAPCLHGFPFHDPDDHDWYVD